jgi:hypothetical protein
MKIHGAWLWLLLVVTLKGAEGAAPADKPARPVPGVEHVLIVSVDGLRPDRALLADMPTLRGMINAGTYTFWARTTVIAITLPSHTSMLTGVTPRKHGIEWNRDLPLREEIYPRVPTLFELAGRQGLTSALIAGKSKFKALNKPGTVTHVSIPEGKDEKTDDAAVSAAAVPIIEKHKPAVIFVHYPDVDSNGHAKGWGSPEQLAAIERVDGEIAKLLAALDRAGIRKSTTVILTSDHGGAGRSHGPEDPRSRHIPWIASGTGVLPRLDLTQFEPLEVNTEDTAATACWLLGIPLPANLDGKPVKAAFAPAP